LAPKEPLPNLALPSESPPFLGKALVTGVYDILPLAVWDPEPSP
jgi:hypothetical protein